MLTRNLPIIMLLSISFFLVYCGKTTVGAADVGLPGCQSLDLISCQNTSGCYWSTSPGSISGAPSGCLTMTQCSQATSSGQCSGTTSPITEALCSWGSNSCEDSSTGTLETSCLGILQNKCQISYILSGPCAWIANGYGAGCQQDTSVNRICNSVVFMACASNSSICTWGLPDSNPCLVNSPFTCTRQNGNCCIAGSASCTTSDPACIETGPESCAERANLVCTPNNNSNPTACLFGSCSFWTDKADCQSYGCTWRNNTCIDNISYYGPPSAVCSLASPICQPN